MLHSSGSLGTPSPRWAPVPRLCGLVQAAASAWSTRSGGGKGSRRDRVEWKELLGQPQRQIFRHSKMIASFFVFLCIPNHKRLWGIEGGRKPLTIKRKHKGVQLQTVICVAWGREGWGSAQWSKALDGFPFPSWCHLTWKAAYQAHTAHLPVLPSSLVTAQRSWQGAYSQPSFMMVFISQQ